MPFLPGGAPPIFTVLFFLFIIIFIYAVGRQVITAIDNVGQPVIAREARIVARRQHTSVHGAVENTPSSSSTSYFVTFEFPDGHREELSVRANQYGLLAEGDVGTLHSQGTWFKGFERAREQQ